MPPNSRPTAPDIVAYEAQPTRMFGSYSVTAHYADGSSDAIAYGSLPYCMGEAERLNAGLKAGRGDAPPAA